MLAIGRKRRTACYSPAIWAEARGWLTDCGMDPDEADECSDAQIRALIRRHYDGGTLNGWSGFLRDAFPS